MRCGGIWRAGVAAGSLRAPAPVAQEEEDSAQIAAVRAAEEELQRCLRRVESLQEDFTAQDARARRSEVRPKSVVSGVLSVPRGDPRQDDETGRMPFSRPCVALNCLPSFLPLPLPTADSKQLPDREPWSQRRSPALRTTPS